MKRIKHHIFLLLLFPLASLTAANPSEKSSLSAKNVSIGATCIAMAALTSKQEPSYDCMPTVRQYDTSKTTDNSLIFAHGLLGSGAQEGGCYFQPFFGSVEPPFTLSDGTTFKVFNFSDPLGRTSPLAQGSDIESLKKVIEIPDKKTVDLFGISRGAATCVNLLGTQTIEKPIGSVVLESPFGSIKDVVDHKARFGFLAPLIGLFFYHSPQGIQPVDAAKNFPKNVPVLILCSKEDALIPAASSESIAAALRKAGHKKVYCQTYENGLHGGVVLGNPESQELMHAFWKAHNRPHNPALAEKGTDAFERLQKNQ